MKNVCSLKISSHRFRLLNILELYKFCQSCSSNIYIYAKEKCCKVEQLPRLVSFVISIHCQDLMIVIEGKHSMKDKIRLEDLLKLTDPVQTRSYTVNS